MSGPSIPESLSVTAGATYIDVNWQEPANTDGGIMIYDIQWTTTANWANLNGGGYDTASPFATNYQIPNLSSGTYYVRVRANSMNIGEWAYSSAVTVGGGGGPVGPVAGIITGTSATAGGSGQLNVSWSFPGGYTATSTVVYYTTTPITSVQDLQSMTLGMDYNAENLATATNTSTTISGLANSTTYYLIVDSTGDGGLTATSAAFSGSTSIGAGASGDPYITTVSGTSYKLPIMNGAIRMYQGEVAGKTLTVNATLRTQSSKDLMVHNLRSAIELTKTMSTKKAEMFMKSICEKEETLCFFESFYVQHGEKVLAVNVWDGKLKVQHYTGGFKTLAHKNGDEALKASSIYSKYSGSTLEVEVAPGASVFLSVYNSPMVRSGLYVNAPAMKEGNGVTVNVLSAADMTLPKVNSVAPVPRRDTTVLRTKKEMFADHDGTRVRNIVMTC